MDTFSDVCDDEIFVTFVEKTLQSLAPNPFLPPVTYKYTYYNSPYHTIILPFLIPNMVPTKKWKNIIPFQWIESTGFAFTGGLPLQGHGVAEIKGACRHKQLKNNDLRNMNYATAGGIGVLIHATLFSKGRMTEPDWKAQK